MLQPRTAAVTAAVALASLASVPGARAQFVFSPSATPSEIAYYTDAYRRAVESDERYVTTTRWPGTLGQGTQVFVSYVPDGLLIPSPPGVTGGDLPSVLFGTLDTVFTPAGGRAFWLKVIANPELPQSQTSSLDDGGAVLWNNISGALLQFIRRPVTSSSNPLDVWDDGAAWSAPGPAHPPPSNPTVLTVTLNPVLLATASLSVNATSTGLTLVSGGTSLPAIDFGAANADTLGELVTRIETLAGVPGGALDAGLAPGVSGSTPSTILGPNQTINLSAATPTGSLVGAPPARGDIRISMRPLPPAIFAFATAAGASGGDIILNSAPSGSANNWRFGTRQSVLRNTVARAVGQALGLDLVCPSDKTKLMEPILNTTLSAPGIDDVRGMHRLYGDAADPDQLGFSVPPGLVTEPNDDPTVAVGTANGPWNLGSVIDLPGAGLALGASLDDLTDVDYFLIDVGGGSSVVDFDVVLTVTPVGGTYPIGPNAAACSGTPFNAGAVMDLRVNIFTPSVAGPPAAGGEPLGNGSPTSTGPFTSFISTAAAGAAETITARIQQGGQYLIGVSATGVAGTESQLYNLLIRTVDRNQPDGVALGPVVSEALFVLGQQAPSPTDPQPRLDGFNGLGTLAYEFFTNDRNNANDVINLYNNHYFGARARYATIEGGYPDENHIAFGGRAIDAVRWNGVNPAAGAIQSHATGTAAVGTGTTIPRFNSFFSGVAPEAEQIASSVASFVDVTTGDFAIGIEALYYSLFAISDPATAAQIGLAGPATVINSGFGSSFRERGDTGGRGFVALAYDAAVTKYGVTVVTAAGNDGRIDFTDECGTFIPGNGGDFDDFVPGRQFVGSRTISSPASAFNVLTVGAAGKGRYTVEFPPPPIDDGGGGGGGGGGGRPEGPRGGPGPVLDPRGIAINTIPNFSAKGPVDTYDYAPTNPQLQPNTRSGVHLVAAGSGTISRAIDPDLDETATDPCSYYGLGHTQIRGLAVPDTGSATNDRFTEDQGTSFAAASVAGAVALLQDFGLAQIPPQSIDSLVMRAVLMTSAFKMPGWHNSGGPASPQDDLNGRAWVRETDLVNIQISGPQPVLDLAQGAGLLNIPRAFSIYALGDLKDSAQTNPNVPSRTRMDEASQPSVNPGRPGSGASGDRKNWTPEELEELERLYPAPKGPTTAEIERFIQDMRAIDRETVFRPLADITDPNLQPGSGGKSGAGTFDGRVPVGSGGTTPGGFRGNGPSPAKPTVISAPIQAGSIGWDIGNLGIESLRLVSGGRLGGVIDYVIDVPRWPAFTPPEPPPGPPQSGPLDYLTATLVWNREVVTRAPNFSRLDNPQVGVVTAHELENLDLELYYTFDGVVLDGQQPVAFSRSTQGNIEHLHFPVQLQGRYVLRVTWTGQNYNVFQNLARGGVKFGLAWAWHPEMHYRVAAPNSLPPPPEPEAPASGVQLLGTVLFHFGTRSGEAGYSPLADIDRDGAVDSRDLVIVLTRMYQPTQPPPAPNTAQE